jgi:DNA repair exonuclease SbcCD ATPase subunit
MSLESKEDYISWLLEQDSDYEKKEKAIKAQNDTIRAVNNVYKNKFMEAYKAMRDAPGDKEAKNDYLVAFTEMYRNVIRR